jgi:hypothetical protein
MATFGVGQLVIAKTPASREVCHKLCKRHPEWIFGLVYFDYIFTIVVTPVDHKDEPVRVETFHRNEHNEETIIETLVSTEGMIRPTKNKVCGFRILSSHTEVETWTYGSFVQPTLWGTDIVFEKSVGNILPYKKIEFRCSYDNSLNISKLYGLDKLPRGARVANIVATPLDPNGNPYPSNTDMSMRMNLHGIACYMTNPRMTAMLYGMEVPDHLAFYCMHAGYNLDGGSSEPHIETEYIYDTITECYLDSSRSIEPSTIHVRISYYDPK